MCIHKLLCVSAELDDVEEFRVQRFWLDIEQERRSAHAGNKS